MALEIPISEKRPAVPVPGQAVFGKTLGTRYFVKREVSIVARDRRGQKRETQFWKVIVVYQLEEKILFTQICDTQHC